MAKYAIGLDYGTLSGRALVVNVETGEELASSIYEYPHAVMDEALPCGKKLGQDWALQHPQDYIDVLSTTIPDAIKKSGIDANDVNLSDKDFADKYFIFLGDVPSVKEKLLAERFELGMTYSKK